MQTFKRQFTASILTIGALAIFSPSLMAQSPVPAERDLALAFPLESLNLVPMSLDMGLSGGKLFPKSWFQELNRSFQSTAAGSVLETESPYEDWRIVSARVEPCNPLGQNPQQNISELCWPELRLVWQPILRNIRLHELLMKASGEDRAIHTIYPINPAVVLNSDESARVAQALTAIASGTAAVARFTSLPAAQMKDFVSLRNRVSAAVLKDVLALRKLPQGAYAKIGLRPEMQDSSPVEISFLKSFQGLLQKYAATDALRLLTAFSLPEGREPAALDEWVFLSFKASGGQIKPEPISIIAHDSNKILQTTSHVNHGSMTRDEESLYESENLELLKESVLLFINDRSRLLPLISDRSKRLVPNTSCISCHKLNDIRFDLHNFSYLEDRELTVSPRVVKDVQLDLDWIRSHKLAN
ncbi:MAG: hypothetical protein H7318_12285 [Oligoflexus sp.]|nr:hypothetical protein [Oligoflexus sp.]